jgi:hypothetical protein
MADEETEYISMMQAVKLITVNFNGNPKKLREFCEGEESTRQVVHPTSIITEICGIQNNQRG